MNNTTTIQQVLEEAKGKEIDLVIVHHVEGQHLRTTGKLLDLNEEIIQLELEFREHWYSRKKKAVYTVNRKACSLLSVVVLDLEVSK